MTAEAGPRASSGGAAPELSVVVLTGLSGAGKTAATKLFEDLGYATVDNLPTELLPSLAGLVADDPARFEHVAIVLDVRAGDVESAFRAVRASLSTRGIRPRVLFLEARDEVLIRRFSETRHRHPLSGQKGIAGSIAEERRLLATVRDEADVIIDTSDLSLRELRERLFASIPTDVDPDRLVVQVVSFGFKFGVPLEADIVLDVRFLKNPYYVPQLKQISGLTDPVRTYVLEQPLAVRFLDQVGELLDLVLPAYMDEGKTRLTIAVGCTGGYHRSIVVGEEIASRLRAREDVAVAVFHRELEQA
jgi:RNase adapter protein RapZ